MTDHFDLLERPIESETTVVQTGLTLGFGNQCNEYVDVIQQALDLALGNTGNLAPDSAVVDALDELYLTARDAGASALLQLLVPLNQVLRSAEQSGFTLSQADTLLVQEAIIAITLGIDSIVNKKPTPGLLSDVTQRMVDVAAENKHEIRANSEATGLVNIFVSDADELLQRLFEQIQRWRASALVGRGHEEVNRLLQSLHDSAETAGLSSIATVVYMLTSRMSAQRVAKEVPDDDFFDLAIETIEVLGDDLDRIRNNEQLIDHTELHERLALEGVDSVASVAEYRSAATATGEPQSQIEPGVPPLAEHTEAPQVGLPEKNNGQTAGQGIEHRHTDPEVIDMHLLDSAVDSANAGKWPDHRELIDVLREISRGNEAIKDRIEQLRRTIHVYPDARQVTIESNAEPGSAVSAVDNIFFKIDSLLSRQRKSVTNMASVLGVVEQQTVEALGAGLIKHAPLTGLTAEYINGADKVVIDSRLYDHLGYALRITLDTVVLPSLIKKHDRTATHTAKDKPSDAKIVFDLVGNRVIVKIIGRQLHLSEFVIANASLRSVDEQMLKTQLPRPTGLEKLDAAAGINTKAQHARANDNDLVTLAAFQRLIDIAAFFQGKVTTLLNWDDMRRVGRGEIEMMLPISALSEELVLVKRGLRLYGVPTASIEKIESASRRGLEQEELEGPADGVVIQCRLGDGQHSSVRADTVIGKQMVSVTSKARLMLGDAYCGAFVFSDSSLVLVVNPEMLVPDAVVELPG